MKHRRPGPPVAARDIPPERKALYYAGMAVGLAGFLLFASNFFLIGSGPGGETGFAGRALGGMALVVAGAAMRTVAARGLAGSGFALNPDQARRDLEPWTRAGGGMIADALDEIPAAGRFLGEPEGRTAEVVRVRCPHCRALNAESARFCDQCGERI